jgi:putative membrane protein
VARRPFARPHRDIGQDPDYRFTLANERTFLAWIRTALALNAGGLAVIQLLPDMSPSWGREILGVALVALGTLVAATSFRRWARNEQALRTDAPLAPSTLPLVLAVGLVVVSLLGLLLLIFGVER